MDTSFEARCTSLRQIWAWWARIVGSFDEATWARPTRLEGWDVAALVAHHALLVQGLGYLATQPLDEAPATTSARDMLRGFNRPEGVAHTAAASIAEMARDQAATLTHGQLVGLFADLAPRSLEAARTAGDITVEYFGNGTFPLGGVLEIATLEGVVHGLDLAAAVGIPSSTLPEAPVTATAHLLASLADPVTFIEAATGRAAEGVLPVLR